VIDTGYTARSAVHSASRSHWSGVPSAVAASLVAGRLSARLRPQRLSRGFAVFLVAVAGYTLVNSISALTG